jgi:hypothetical protein
MVTGCQGEEPTLTPTLSLKGEGEIICTEYLPSIAATGLWPSHIQ